MSNDQINVIPSGAREGEEKKYLVRWKNRQKMAWYSFCMIVFLALSQWYILPVWFKYMEVDAKIWEQHISESSIWVYGALSSVILAYMGFTTWSLRGNSFSVKEEDY